MSKKTQIIFFFHEKEKHTIPISGLRVVTQAQHDFEGKKKRNVGNVQC